MHTTYTYTTYIHSGYIHKYKQPQDQAQKAPCRADSPQSKTRTYPVDLGCQHSPRRKQCHTGRLRLVGFLKSQVSFAEYRLFYRALWEKRPVILMRLRIVATPYTYSHRVR